MKIQLTIDLDRLLADRKAKGAFERFFSNFPPDRDKLMHELGVKQEDVDAMLAYFVVKTVLEDDGMGRAYRLLGLAAEQKTAGV